MALASTDTETPLGPSRVMTANEVAAVFLQSDSQPVRRMIRAGKLPAIKVGKHYLIARKHVEAILAELEGRSVSVAL